MKHLLKLLDLSRGDILSILNLADQLKYELAHGIPHRHLEGKTLGMIFQKSSTRTRVSFETGIYQLGGYGLFLSSNDLQIGRGEPVEDTARVLSRYVQGVMIRTFEHDKVESLARHAGIPVINGLTDSHHPCQALTDYFTIYERNRDIRPVKMTYIGDGNNVANSLIQTAALLGSSISVAAPNKFQPEASIIDSAMAVARQTGASIEITDDVERAVAGANYLYTDVWTSMGQEKETARRKKIFAGYRITSTLLKEAAPGCLVMHCLPAHRGEEIDEDVIESGQSIVFDQAENRLHVQKAIICALLR